MKLSTASMMIVALVVSPLTIASTVVNTSISAEELKAAQDAWGKALIQISSANDKGGQKQATETAKQVLDQAYGYKHGAVLFKPTLTSGEQTFRTTYDGALAYFVGGNSKFPNDSGFALKGWTDYKYENAAVYMNGDLVLTTGKVHLTGKDGKVTTVDKTWGFKKDDEGKLRIVLHHSSLPYSSN
ncbi:phosphoribosyl-AMP cyclohydrolase [Rheinheimera mesophila]|uniref:Phosphoribosyl-AMP cyclohydrolase n=1 Tax=Rheinheimera mesophila TaxID=1547515 RepID=A0A3P3QKV6_9GAMM|nr:phosphoribosyl-AMP cyclohydrolase [Rheinheimera mesophila]KKL02897.1 phosphoribosyl-AMP cyclohydrolase [Rheinheimera mesophila]RRJ21110.1 phosphoribosyl-AMP cyclohydrolase [Rheinheimera mesophila]